MAAMMGFKKDMEAAMNGCKSRGETASYSALQKMYNKYVSKAEMEDEEMEEGDEEEMEKMRPGRGDRAKKMEMAKKSLGDSVRLAFLR